MVAFDGRDYETVLAVAQNAFWASFLNPADDPAISLADCGAPEFRGACAARIPPMGQSPQRPEMPYRSPSSFSQ